mmetsp:Transcript_15109/g.48189  ORF Transcript_15109/g.48189 Transcript_15109/m.48189 type:complete len:400 (+) Transcript_15109:431-1630(+)
MPAGSRPTMKKLAPALRRPLACHCTSVGPAYIMGDGKMASTVLSLSRYSPFSSTAWCCSMRTCKGTSSLLVQPPSGCSSSTGRLKPRDSSRSRVSFISSACPLWIGLRSWNANTASARLRSNSARSSLGVRRYWSSPSPHRTRSSTSTSPPSSHGPAAITISTYGCPASVVPNCRAHRSSCRCSNTSGRRSTATGEPPKRSATASAPAMAALLSSEIASTIGTDWFIRSTTSFSPSSGVPVTSLTAPPCSSARCMSVLKCRHCRYSALRMKPRSGAAQPSDSTCTHCMSTCVSSTDGSAAASAATASRRSSGTNSSGTRTGPRCSTSWEARMPRSCRKRSTVRAHSSTPMRPACTARSGDAGASYGASTPVKPLISPARARAYRCLGSRASHTSSCVST